MGGGGIGCGAVLNIALTPSTLCAAGGQADEVADYTWQLTWPLSPCRSPFMVLSAAVERVSFGPEEDRSQTWQTKS